MGKMLIVKGADFSKNGILEFWGATLNVVGRYAFRIINTLPTSEGDAGTNSKQILVERSQEIPLTEIYKGFMFGKNNIDGDTYTNTMSSIRLKIKSPLQTANSMFLNTTAESIDLSEVLFSNDANGDFAFKNAKIKSIYLPSGFPIGSQCFSGAKFDNVLDISDSVLKGRLSGYGSNADEVKSDLNVTCYTLIAKNINLKNNTSGVTNFNQIFFNSRIQKIDLSGWDVSESEYFASTFQGWTGKTLILDGWDLSTPKTNYSGMFLGCNYLTEISVKGCNSATKNFLIARLSDVGFTFVESVEGLLTKTS